MQRRLFLTSTVTTATGLSATGFSGSSLAAPLPEANITGVVTLYTEFRVAGPAHTAAMAALQEIASELKSKSGFLSLALKQMSGESTMTKNYPVQYKGVLAEAYLHGVEARTQPFFYALFVRFADYVSLRSAKAEALFTQSVLPHLHAIAPGPNGPVKSPQPMAIYQGVFQTVAAGNRKGVYNNEVEIKEFLRHPVEIPANNTVTVANHVMVADATHLGWEVQVATLLKVAQETFQPLTEPEGLGLPGAPDNRNYRKALSTEILRNAFADGSMAPTWASISSA